MMSLQFVAVRQGIATSAKFRWCPPHLVIISDQRKRDIALEAASLKTIKPGRHPDGRYGLYFNVIENSRTWVQRLTIDGKRRNFGLGPWALGLGPWPVVSLSGARDIAFENVRKRHRGIDPIAERERAAAMPTFAQALDAYITLRAGGLPRDDIEHIIASCDRATPMGLRDRAIVLLLARLALRAGDVAKWKYININSLLPIVRWSALECESDLPPPAGTLRNPWTRTSGIRSSWQLHPCCRRAHPVCPRPQDAFPLTPPTPLTAVRPRRHRNIGGNLACTAIAR